MNDRRPILPLVSIGNCRPWPQMSRNFQEYSWPCSRAITLFSVFTCSSLFPNKSFYAYLEYPFFSIALQSTRDGTSGFVLSGDEYNDLGAYEALVKFVGIYTPLAGYHARCQSYVESLVENVDERQLVVSNTERNRHMFIRQGRVVSLGKLGLDFVMRVMMDIDTRKPPSKRKNPASCNDLYEHGRFSAQGKVSVSWYDLLLPTVENKLNVNFAQSALTGRGSYTPFVARNKSVCLKDSILLCDPASDSIAVAFAGVSDLSSLLKVRISELMKTTESERLRAAFFMCRGAVRARRDVSTRMIDVMLSRYIGLEGIVSISAQDVVEVMDEGELRNHAVLVECMESLAMQGGYRANNGETSLFNALCSNRECEKTILVTGTWPPVFGKFNIYRYGASNLVKLDYSSELAIIASRTADIYRAWGLRKDPGRNSRSWFIVTNDEVVCVQ